MTAFQYHPAGMLRRMAAILYECFLSGAVLFLAAAAFHAIMHPPLSEGLHHLFQAYLFLVLGLYFAWCWLHGGQTLAMKTWRLRLEQCDGSALTVRQALTRYALAWISLIAAGLGFLWAIFDRDHQFLHDRLSGTRIVKVP
jgi:uncharacterized RDD family membrane protein YckC